MWKKSSAIFGKTALSTTDITWTLPIPCPRMNFSPLSFNVVILIFSNWARLCSPGQVVNAHVPVTKQYNFVPASGWWFLAAGKVWPHTGHASQTLAVLHLQAQLRCLVEHGWLYRYSRSYMVNKNDITPNLKICRELKQRTTSILLFQALQMPATSWNVVKSHTKIKMLISCHNCSEATA